jgi:glycosyltransferase involved in cell wall biosynthesis
MTAYPETRAFDGATIILPVINETYSLVQTVDSILATSRADLCELLIVVAGKTTPEAMAEIERLADRLGDLVVVHRQNLKFLGGAMREAFDLARGSHAIMMASDLETDPALVPRLIAAAREHPNAIITVTRWRTGGGFEDYSPVKLLANWVFQKLFSLLYWTRLSDMTYAYRIFPTRLVQAIRWEELRHPLLFETLIKPLRLGVEVIEIPGVWRARTEGESQNTFARNFEYFRIGLKVRFAATRNILRRRAKQPISQPQSPPTSRSGATFGIESE